MALLPCRRARSAAPRPRPPSVTGGRAVVGGKGAAQGTAHDPADQRAGTRLLRSDRLWPDSAAGDGPLVVGGAHGTGSRRDARGDADDPRDDGASGWSGPPSAAPDEAGAPARRRADAGLLSLSLPDGEIGRAHV